MAVTRTTGRVAQARDLAHALVDSDPDTEITAEQVDRWSEHDLCDWLELAWGYTWDDDAGRWTPPQTRR